MIAPPDHYEVYYADKLWGLLPTVYRAEDTDQFGANGPLREMVNRIGAQAAILRRSIDRMWEDQSIETCDDWLIPYIGALLGVNLVSGLDARGQRLDVAKTIYYRRRIPLATAEPSLRAGCAGAGARMPRMVYLRSNWARRAIIRTGAALERLWRRLGLPDRGAAADTNQPDVAR
jgi:hypothetical protein